MFSSFSFNSLKYKVISPVSYMTTSQVIIFILMLTARIGPNLILPGASLARFYTIVFMWVRTIALIWYIFNSFIPVQVLFSRDKGRIMLQWPWSTWRRKEEEPLWTLMKQVKGL